MQVINARNVHEALVNGVRHLALHGVPRDSRYGRVLEVPWPVTTVLRRPWERVLFWPERDANPFLHLFEFLWMLAGRQDVAFLAQFAQRMQTFSDDGETLHGAYGHRWRRAFGIDQIEEAVRILQKDPDSRRVVLQMWDARLDLGAVSKDLPCNTHIYVKVRGPLLYLTVLCRSNDIIWGLYGSNAVMFSMLQEYFADRLGKVVTPLVIVSDSFHAYEEVWKPVREMVDRLGGGPLDNPYAVEERCRPSRLVWDTAWEQDLALFMGWGWPSRWHPSSSTQPFQSPFFRTVVIPMWEGWLAYKAGSPAQVTQWLGASTCDWHIAAREWIFRRKAFRLVQNYWKGGVREPAQ